MLARFLKTKSTLLLFILFIEIVFVNQITEFFSGAWSWIYLNQAYREEYSSSRSFPNERRRTAPEIRKYIQNQNKNNNTDLPIAESLLVNTSFPNFSNIVKLYTPTSIYKLQADQRIDIWKFYIYLSLSSSWFQVHS